MVTIPRIVSARSGGILSEHKHSTVQSKVYSMEFYNFIEQIFPDGEFDRDQYAYYDDSTRNLMSNLVSRYAQLPNSSPVNPYALSMQPRRYF